MIIEIHVITLTSCTVWSHLDLWWQPWFLSFNRSCPWQPEPRMTATTWWHAVYHRSIAYVAALVSYSPPSIPSMIDFSNPSPLMTWGKYLRFWLITKLSNVTVSLTSTPTDAFGRFAVHGILNNLRQQHCWKAFMLSVFFVHSPRLTTVGNDGQYQCIKKYYLRLDCEMVIFPYQIQSHHCHSSQGDSPLYIHSTAAISADDGSKEDETVHHIVSLTVNLNIFQRWNCHW